MSDPLGWTELIKERDRFMQLHDEVCHELAALLERIAWRCKGCSAAFPDNREMGANPYCPSCIAKHVLTEQRDALRLRVTQLEEADRMADAEMAESEREVGRMEARVADLERLNGVLAEYLAASAALARAAERRVV